MEVMINDDCVLGEGDEVFDITLQQSAGMHESVSLRSRVHAEVTITAIDDGKSYISFTWMKTIILCSQYLRFEFSDIPVGLKNTTFSEADGVVEVCIEIKENCSATFSFNITASTADDTAGNVCVIFRYILFAGFI